ncbi:hypothetical protein ABZP36_033984 [Zizania latifolia]
MDTTVPLALTPIYTAVEVVLLTTAMMFCTDMVVPTVNVAASTADVAASGPHGSLTAPASAAVPPAGAQPTAEPVVEEATDTPPSLAEPMEAGDAESSPITDDP